MNEPVVPPRPSTRRVCTALPQPLWFALRWTGGQAFHGWLSRVAGGPTDASALLYMFPAGWNRGPADVDTCVRAAVDYDLIEEVGYGTDLSTAAFRSLELGESRERRIARGKHVYPHERSYQVRDADRLRELIDIPWSELIRARGY